MVRRENMRTLQLRFKTFSIRKYRMFVVGCGVMSNISRVGPREQGKRYSKGSRRPQKVRQRRKVMKALVKKLRPLTGHSEGVLIFDIIF